MFTWNQRETIKHVPASKARRRDRHASTSRRKREQERAQRETVVRWRA